MHRHLIWIALGLLVACDDGPAATPDSAAPDAAVIDMAQPDAAPAADVGSMDAGSIDAMPDTGRVDTGLADTGPVDGGASDGSPNDAGAPSGSRVLLVGNSYVASNRIERLVLGFLEDDPAVVDPVVERVSRGGYRLDQHAADADGTHGETALRQALVTDMRQWDMVFLQQQSQIPGFPQGHPQWQAMLEGGRTLHRLIGENGARTTLMMTWGRRDGDGGNPEIFPDFPTMQDLLTAGYRALAAALASPDAPVGIAPVGLAFEAVWRADPADIFPSLYSPDGSHPSLAGSYLAAAVLYRAITGRSAAARTYAPDGLDPQRADALRMFADSVDIEHAPPR